MRHIRTAAAAATVLLAGLGGALAADLPQRAYEPPAPAPVYVAPIYNWTGFYIGGNLGGAGVNATLTSFVNGYSSSQNKTSFIGGGQIGYNYQMAPNWVIGLEWMFDWGGSHNQTAVVNVPNVGAVTGGSNGAKWLTTLTGRVGYAADRALIYVKGGAAWLESSTNIALAPVGGGVPWYFNNSSTRSGWTVGGGLEYAVAPNWTVKGEYDYIGASSATYSGLITGLGGLKLTGNIQTFTVGANYKF